MNNINYKHLIHTAPFGYAYHKIIVDSAGVPIDYQFLEVNTAFEKLTGLKAENIINQKVTQVIPGIEQGTFNWIACYGKIALNGGEKEFEQYSESLNRWYKVQVHSPEKYFFSTTFTDITAEMHVFNISKQFLLHENENVNYQSITDALINISGAKYISFNLFDNNGLDFTSVAISGINENIQKGAKMIGFNLIGKKWKHDEFRAEKIKARITTRFKHLHNLVGEVISSKIIKVLENIFHLGEVALVKITKGDVMLGDFTLLMTEGDTLKNEMLVEIYAQQVGLFLQRKRFEASLHESEERFRTLFEKSNDAIFFVDIFTDKYLDANGAAEVLTGRSVAELKTLKTHQVSPVNAALRLEQLLHSKQSLEIGEIDYIRPDGTIRTAILNTVPLNNGKAYGIAHDITERKNAGIIIKKQINELNELNTTKDKFFSIIAHDLKNPFGIILGYTELLIQKIEKYDIEKIKTLSQIINNSATNTCRLLENLLEWSRLQRGSLVPCFQILNIKTIANASILQCNEMAENKEIAIVCNIAPYASANCDEHMTHTVFRNLITNAIKFSNRGTSISINARKNKSLIEIQITDSGVGIPNEKLPNLFRIDKNISTQGTAKEKGTGLGLLLCKELVEKQGGTIWAESEVGKGSVFHFTLKA